MSDMKRLNELSELLEKQQAALEKAEADLKAAKKAVERTQTEDLPELMMELGFTELKLASGSVVKLKPEVKTAITGKTQARAFAWLRANGYGGLIKTKVGVEFGKDEVEQAHELAEELSARQLPAGIAETVHAGTLKAFVKERREAGEDVPTDLFNIHPYNIVTITRSK